MKDFIVKFLNPLDFDYYNIFMIIYKGKRILLLNIFQMFKYIIGWIWGIWIYHNKNIRWSKATYLIGWVWKRKMQEMEPNISMESKNK